MIRTLWYVMKYKMSKNFDARRDALFTLKNVLDSEFGIRLLFNDLVKELKEKKYKNTEERGGSYLASSAASALGWLGDLDALEPLIDALADDIEDVRETAAIALGWLDDPKAVDPLIDALQRENWGAAKSLARLQDPRAADPLLKALSSTKFTLVLWAARALRNLKDTRATEPIINVLINEVAKGDREYIVSVLGDLGDTRAIEPLIGMLGDNNKKVRQETAKALDKLGEPHWQVIIKGEKEDFDALAEIDDKRVISPLINALGNSDSRIRIKAANALYQWGEKKWEDIVYQMTNDSKEGWSGLAYLKDPRILSALTNALGEEKEQIKEIAATTMVEFGDSLAVQPLIRLLYRITPGRDPGLKEMKVASLVTKSLGGLGDISAVNPLLWFLELQDRDSHSCSAYFREYAISSLANLCDAREQVKILKSLGCNEEEISEILKALGILKVYEPLVNALEDEEDLVRKAAADALVQLGDLRAMQPLTISSEKGNTWAASALRRLKSLEHSDAAESSDNISEDERNLEELEVAIDNGDWRERCKAAKGLGKLHNVQAAKRLIQLLQDNHWQVQKSVVEALGENHGPESTELIFNVLRNNKTMKTNNWRVRFASAHALFKLIRREMSLFRQISGKYWGWADDEVASMANVKLFLTLIEETQGV